MRAKGGLYVSNTFPLAQHQLIMARENGLNSMKKASASLRDGCCFGTPRGTPKVSYHRSPVSATSAIVETRLLHAVLVPPVYVLRRKEIICWCAVDLASACSALPSFLSATQYFDLVNDLVSSLLFFHFDSSLFLAFLYYCPFSVLLTAALMIRA
jgi:hypothetical protein